MRKYVAKKDHKNPCDLCGMAIVGGDVVVSWTWTNAEWEGPGARGPYGGICFVHETCDVLGKKWGCTDDERMRDFEEADDDRGLGEDDPDSLVLAGAKAIAAARAKSDPATALRGALANVRLYVASRSHGTNRSINDEDAGHLLRFCADVGVVGSVLRDED